MAVYFEVPFALNNGLDFDLLFLNYRRPPRDCMTQIDPCTIKIYH